MLCLLKTINLFGIHHYCPPDTEELFKKNLSQQPSDWYWRTHSVTYTLNSQGFRCGEFSELDWNSSILAFGCSNTFGIAVDDSDAWPYKLAQFTKIPVINLAQGGQGWGYNWVNSLRVIAEGHKPRAVVYYWPDTSRMFTLIDSQMTYARGHGTWNADRPDAQDPSIQLGLSWALDPYLGEFWADQYRQSLDIMWGSRGVPVYHCTWSRQFTRPQVQFIPLYTDPQNLTARGRDLIHPGPQDHTRIALKVVDRMNLS